MTYVITYNKTKSKPNALSLSLRNRMMLKLGMCLAAILALVAVVDATEIKYPVILVPGDGGTQLLAKLDKPKAVHYLCTKKTKYWFNIWLNLELIAPYVLDCFADNLRLLYNEKNHTTSNSPGVQIRVPGFGGTDSVEWLDPSHVPYTTYFYYIADYLVKKHGYVRGKSIRGVPFDFRKAPNELGETLSNMTKLIEETYKANGNKQVVLMGHSYGNILTWYFLVHKPQTWKDKYIRSWIDMSGPLAGAAKPVRLSTSGDNLNLYPVDPLKARPQQRSMPSTHIMLPYEGVWGKDEVLVSTQKRNYTVRDYEQLFKDINYLPGWFMRQDTAPLMQDLKPPGVEVHNLHGVSVDTPASFHWTGKMKFPDQQPSTVMGDGDGTVNRRSLEACLKWSKQQKQPVYHKVLHGSTASHLGILENEEAIQYIAGVATGNITLNAVN